MGTMKKCVPSWVLVLGVGLCAAGCEDASDGYNDGSGYNSGSTNSTNGSSGSANNTGSQSTGSTGNTNGSGNNTGSGNTGNDAAVSESSDLQLSSQGYLTDGSGQPLYFFANDLPGAQASACAGDCVTNWPVFDANEPTLGAGLDAADVDRFMREDGSWQTTFQGRPLYTFANEASGTAPAGDGVGGRWSVARDYFIFMASSADVTPRNNDTAGTPFFTNKSGRTLYIFENDTAGTDAADPVSACADACLDAWPAWVGPDDLSGIVLPSGLSAADVTRFQRQDGSWQLAYRGWPLYYFASDDEPGEVEGHSRQNWTTINASSFGAVQSSAFVGGY